MAFLYTTSWPLSSDKQTTEEEEEEDDDAISAFCDSKTLATIFSRRHSNLLSVVMTLMDKHGLELAVATPFLDSDEEYVMTGNYDYAKCDMVSVTSLMICAVGSIEKVLIAALQTFFMNGKRNAKGTDFYVYHYNNQREQVCDVTIHLKYNGHAVNVKLAQNGSGQCISIYIDD